MLRKILKLIAIVIALLVVAVGLFMAFFDFDEAINEQKDEYLPELAKALGREVTVGQVKTTFFPVLGAEIRDVQVAGVEGGAAPLRIERVVFQVALWDAVKSGGDNVQLKQLVIDGLTVDVTRRPDGTLDVDDILARLQDGPPPDEAPKPLDPEAKAFINGLRLTRVALENTRLKFTDQATGGAPAELAINNLLVELTDAALSNPLNIRVEAAVFSDQRNLEIETQLGPLPIGQPDAPLPIAFIALKADGLDLSPIGPYLGKDSPLAMRSAKVDGSIRVDDPLGMEAGRVVKGDLKVAGLAFGGGKAFDLATALDVSQPRLSGRLDVTEVRVAIDDMTLRAQGSVSGLTTGRLNIEGLKVESGKLDFGRLLERLPPAAAALPEGAVFEGPFTLTAQLDGDADERQMKADLDFTQARIRWPGALDKPKGTPLAQKLDAHHAGDTLDLQDFDLQVGPMRLRLKGKVISKGDPTVDLAGGTGKFPIEGLVRLLPAVRDAVPPDVRIGGQAEIALKAKGNASAFDGFARVAVSAADLGVPGATLRGSGAIEASAKGTPDALQATLGADLSGLAIQAGDGFRKAGGVPLTADVALRQAGARLNLDRFVVVAGPATLSGDGSLARDGSAADLRFKLADFVLGELQSLLPGGIDGPMAKAKIGLDAGVRGNLAAPDTLAIEVPSLRFAHGRSRLTASASVRNGPKPVIRFDARAPFLDVDAISPPGPDEAPPPEAEGPPTIPDSVLALDFRGRFRADKVRARGMNFEDFDAQITLRDGQLNVQQLGTKAFGGRVSAAGTKANLALPQPKLNIALQLEKVAIDRVLSEFAGMKRSLTGRMSSAINVEASGLSWAPIAESLTGALSADLQNGSLRGANLEEALFTKAVRKLPFLKMGSARSTLAIRRVAGQFEVKGGQMRLKQPMDMQTPEGPIQFTGGIGLDGSLDLSGTIQVAPGRVAQLSSGRIKPKAPVPVALKLGGTLTDPEFEGVEGDKLATALVALAGAAALGALEDKVGVSVDEAKAKARAEAAALKARAKAEANAAKARAKAEADRVKAEAKRKADAAKRKAKNRAKDEAKKALKGLF